MRLHLASLPHTQTTAAYSACAYTQKAVKFAAMMTARGHEVVLYSGEENEAPATEHVPCISKEFLATCGFEGPADYTKIIWEQTQPYFIEFNRNVVHELQQRHRERELILLTTSWPNQPIADAFPWPQNQLVEYGIGYKGTMSKYLVFESHAWRNYVYGIRGWNGDFFHTVIPNYYDPAEFPLSEKRDDYFLFIGRHYDDSKGLAYAVETCERLGVPLVIAGKGNPPRYGEYVGMVGPEERGKLMSRALGVFVPTMYVGPFEGVHAEANLCGTPVITTDWGIFTDTVTNGFNGQRCTMFRDFVRAAEQCKTGEWDYAAIQRQAVSRFSYDAVAPLYEDYFDRLLSLWGEGFYG